MFPMGWHLRLLITSRQAIEIDDMAGRAALLIVIKADLVC